MLFMYTPPPHTKFSEPNQVKGHGFTRPEFTILLPLRVVEWRETVKSCPSFPSHQPMAGTGNSHVEDEAITTYPSNTLKFPG